MNIYLCWIRVIYLTTYAYCHNLHWTYFGIIFISLRIRIIKLCSCDFWTDWVIYALRVTEMIFLHVRVSTVYYQLFLWMKIILMILARSLSEVQIPLVKCSGFIPYVYRLRKTLDASKTLWTAERLKKEVERRKRRRKKYRCIWVKVPYPVPEDCVCSCWHLSTHTSHLTCTFCIYERLDCVHFIGKLL